MIAKSLLTNASGDRNMAYVARLVLNLATKKIASSSKSPLDGIKVLKSY